MCAERHITERDFYLPAHATVYRCLFNAWSAGDPIDFITITQSLRDSHELEGCGGAGYVTELFTFLPTAANAAEYLEILEEKSALRRLITVCEDYRRRGYEHLYDVPNLILAAQQDIAAVTIRGAVEQKPFRTLLMETVDSIERGDDATADILSGIQSLDALVRMRRGNFIVIAGETKSGKTALAGNILANAAVRQEKRAVVFSLEMTATELIKRCISSEGRVNVAMMGRQPSSHEIGGVQRAVVALSTADIELVCDTYDLGSIIARARQLHAKRPLDLIVLDYLQLVEFSTGRRGETRQEIVAQISGTCKRLAGELNCVFIGLSQLNDDGKLRESRAIGQDANAVISVDKEEDGGRVLRVVAQRNGASGVEAAVQWIPNYTKFEDR
jgi:replicative DNA helicase